MHDIPILAVGPAGALVLLTAGVVLYRAAARTRAARNATARPEPHSVVHLLVTDGELREAVERASRFERTMAEALEHRAAHYESLLSPPRAADIRPLADPDAGTSRRTQPA